jgi:hypothetical protein
VLAGGGPGGPAHGGTGFPDESVTVPEPGTGLPSTSTKICGLPLPYLEVSRSVTRTCMLAVPPANALSLTAESNPGVICVGTPGASQGGVGGEGGVFAFIPRLVPVGSVSLGVGGQAASCRVTVQDTCGGGPDGPPKV